MDSIRYIILGGLAVVTYLLLLAWQTDYPTQPPQQLEPSEIPASVDLSDVPAAPQVLDASDTPASVPADIPTLGSTPPSTTASTPNQNTLVSIKTDVLNMQIDLRGGDIVFASLPEHQQQLDETENPFVLLESGSLRNYVAQSGLIGPDGIDASTRPLFQAAANEYLLNTSEDSLRVDLTYQTPENIAVTKRFEFERGSYLVNVSYLINNRSERNWQANLFAQIKRGNFADPSQTGGVGMSSFLGFAITTPDDPYIKINFSDIDNNRPDYQMSGGWIAFSQHYFLSAWVSPTDTLNNFSLRKNSLNEYIGGFTSAAFTVPPGSTNTRTVQFYAGPKDQYTLREVADNLDLTIDYGWLWFIASPIYWLLRQINNLVGNYGWSILLLTVVVKGIFYKLSATSYRSMANMRRVMPKMSQLKERYGDDKMKLQKATMELYQKEKINPFGGCLPMLVQMPVFIALYWVLMESVELRHAPFMLWIDDLSVMDPYFVLPLLMGASMFAQSYLSPAPSDPMQAKIMRFMPVAMTVFFLWFPAGLVLYWLANSVIGIVQQWYITRKIELEFAEKEARKT
ncbi:MAG: membrane protein insertase YidC [Pseudomonadales bacterium]|nr:membrane protein insertase YidC [Pseudomonadales bacterium]